MVFLLQNQICRYLAPLQGLFRHTRKHETTHELFNSYCSVNCDWIYIFCQFILKLIKRIQPSVHPHNYNSIYDILPANIGRYIISSYGFNEISITSWTEDSPSLFRILFLFLFPAHLWGLHFWQLFLLWPLYKCAFHLCNDIRVFLGICNPLEATQPLNNTKQCMLALISTMTHNTILILIKGITHPSITVQPIIFYSNYSDIYFLNCGEYIVSR